VPYRIEYLREAEGVLLSLPRDVRRSVRRRVQALADTPRPAWADYMWGEWEGYWRFHVGPGAYRVIYTIEDHIRRVLIIRVGHRGWVYHQPPPSR
jgi:mRNA-degrading endonuclease RelE of RelBE toxin-antitoxin system